MQRINTYLKAIMAITATVIIASCDNAPQKTAAPAKDSLPANKTDTAADDFDNRVTIDTFKVDGQYFRMVHDRGNTDGDLEKLSGTAWKQIKHFPLYALQQGYDYNKDVNLDGFNDFIFFENRYTNSIYFYNASTKTFDSSDVGSDCCYWNLEVLDSTQKIECDAYSTVMTGEDHSHLFKFNGTEPYYYYLMQYFVNKESRGIDSVVLYKCIGGSEDKTERIDKLDIGSDSTYFDYKTYWQNNYKHLLGLQ